VAAHRDIIKKAVMAGTTPNIDMGHSQLVAMADTVPVLSGIKWTKGTDAHFWHGKWCAGTVIGREPGGVMVQYPDGIGIHDGLYTR
jgi:hypothetical protein